MTYKTDRNVIGRQITSVAGGASPPSVLLTTLAWGWPTVTGSQALDVSGCTGVGGLVAADDDAAIAKGWTITLT